MIAEWYKGYLIKACPSYLAPAEARVFWNHGNTTNHVQLLLPKRLTFQTQQQALIHALTTAKAWIDGDIILSPAQSAPAH